MSELPGQLSVSIVMGSKSDLRVMQSASEFLVEMAIAHEIDIISAHRTPRRLHDYAESLVDRGIDVVIAGAGGAAHLPGMIASMTVVPVIGVPVATTKLAGIDSLLSIVQMPTGVPVATMAVDNAKNAAIFATQIIAVREPDVRTKLTAYKNSLEKLVEAAARDTASVMYPNV
ncbi:MAG: 5-(carboxyamino)imidazole ribonucleotide mutase [Gammaproteobacteria bacterium]|jgi:5-(carboxyamino)imidazole ribonucleotide mutase